MHRFPRCIVTFVVSSLLLMFAACGGSSKSNNPPPAGAKVTIRPSTAAPVVNQPVQFTATVTGLSNTAVTWAVQENTGGTVNAGLYQAPWANGTYHVVATSVADPTKSATATVAVSAVFGFLERLPNGISWPWSVTPVLGTFGANGTFSTKSIIDSSTGLPKDGPIWSVFLSADGKKAVFDMATTDSWGFSTVNVYSANSDGTGITQLTFNQPEDNYFDWLPAISQDGKKIVFSHENDNVSPWTEMIYAMNADGTGMSLVFGTPGTLAWTPSFSPDGKTIIAEVQQQIGSDWYDGVATMDTYGHNVVQLTGQYDPACNASWDEMPSFSNDGTQIHFSRVCYTPSGVYTDTVYTMSADGTSLMKLHGDGATFMSTQPRPVGDKIVFASNVDFPYTDQLDLYSIKPDGSGLTRLTNNTLFDSFSVTWMNRSSADVAQKQTLSPIQKRTQHRKELQERRGTRR